MNAIKLCVLILIAATTSRAQDLDGGDLGSTTPVRVRTWDPVVSKFTAQPRGNNTPAALRLANTKGFPNLVAQWGELKVQSRTRSTNGVPQPVAAADELLSGWAVDEDGLNFIVHRTGNGKDLQSVLRVEPVTVVAEIDILMPASPAERDAITAKYFDVLEYSLAVYDVGGDEADKSKVTIRSAAAAKPVAVLAGAVIAKDDTAQGKNWNGKLIASAEWTPRYAGTFELRVTAKIRGKLAAGDELTVQTVEQNIRLRAIDQKLEIRILSMERESKR